MANLKFHFRSVLYNNLDPYREPLKIKFTEASCRAVDDFSVKYIDGFTKGLIAQSIIAMIDFIVTCFLFVSFESNSLWLLGVLFCSTMLWFNACCFLSQGFTPEECESEDLAPLIRSLRFFKAQYRHQQNPMDFHYEALRH